MDLTGVKGKGPENKSCTGTLRILFVPLDRYPPFRPAAKAIFHKELPERGHCIDWLIQADESCPEAAIKEIKNGVAYIAAADPGRSLPHRVRKHLQNFRNTCRMLSLARRNRYDIIQAKDNVGAAIVGLTVARLCRIRFFYWMAYPYSESSIYEGKARTGRYPFLYRVRGHFFKFLVYKIILPASDHVFVQSEQMKKDLVAEGIAGENMTPIPSSVHLDSIPFAEPPENHKIPDKGRSKWVVYLGTLKRIRKLDFVVRSFSRVVTAEPNAILIIIGEGDQHSELQLLRDEAARLGIENAVIFTGFLDMVDAWEYIRHSDVCLSPYFPTPILQSTSPTKLVEYMAMGKPVVANDHPEQSLVLEESKAGLCTPWEENAFADAIVKILAEPDEAAQMGKRGRQYVERYRTNEAMTDLVEQTYKRFKHE